jgi:hypothetical protein
MIVTNYKYFVNLSTKAMFSNYLFIITVLHLFILPNINSFAQSDSPVWTTINKTLIPEMIQLSEDGNYLHTIHGNYYKKIDLKTDSIVMTVDLKRAVIHAFDIVPKDYWQVNQSNPVYYIDYPFITLSYSKYQVRLNLVTYETIKILNSDVFSYFKSNNNYCIYYYSSMKTSDNLSQINLWDFNKNSIRRIFYSKYDDSVAAVAAGLYRDNEYWIYTSDKKIKIYNAENDSLIRQSYLDLYIYQAANFRLDGDDLYFLTLDGLPTGIKINIQTMVTDKQNIKSIPILDKKINFNMKYANYMGYSSKTDEPKLLIYDLKNNEIKTFLTDSSYFVAFDIDTVNGVLYYLTKGNHDKLFRNNILTNHVDKIITFKLPITDFIIGRDIMTYAIFFPYFVNNFTEYSIKNIDKGNELSTVRFKNGESIWIYNLIYDSTANNFFSIYYNNDNYSNYYSLFNLKEKKVIYSFNQKLFPNYFSPYCLYIKNNYLYTFDFLNKKLIDSIYINYKSPEILESNKDGSLIKFRTSEDNKFLFFYDLNEKLAFKVPYGNYSRDELGIVGNNGNFLSIINGNLILSNFKNQNYSINFGKVNSNIFSITYPKNEKMIITGDNMGKISFWNILTKSKCYEIDLKMDIKKIDLTHDEKGLLVLTGDGSLTMYDVSNILLTDVKEENVISELSIFPNPATDYIEIQPSEGCQPSEGSEIQIFDMLGVAVLSVEQTPSSVQRLDISNLPPGIYFIKIGNRVEKFVKM